MSDNPNLAVVVPTHNRWEEAREALACLAQSEYRNFEVLLIEDGCSDGTSDLCAAEFPDVHILHGDGNLWWSGAINVGVQYALKHGADAVVWLNDDNRVEPQTLGRMVESFKRVGGGRSVICARVKSTLAAEDEWVGEPPRWHPDFGKGKTTDLAEGDVQIQHPPGGRGVLISAHCFRDVGLVDSRSFPHYSADHDFHYRAMKAGYKYFLATGAMVWNVPNPERQDAPERFSLRWALSFLLGRRSPMNMVTLRRLLKRHLSPREYRATYYALLWRSLTWLASGWAARRPAVHRSLRAIRKGLLSSRRV